LQKGGNEMFGGWPTTSSSEIKGYCQAAYGWSTVYRLAPMPELSDQPASAGSATIRFPLADHSRPRGRCESIIVATFFHA
jgi:hypothetical protein